MTVFRVFESLRRRDDNRDLSAWLDVPHDKNIDPFSIGKYHIVRRKIYLTEFLDEKIILNEKYAQRVARNYLYFKWVHHEDHRLSVFVEDIYLERNSIIQKIQLHAFEYVVFRSSSLKENSFNFLLDSELWEKGFYDVFDTALCGLSTGSGIGTQLMSKFEDQLENWWKTDGRYIERQALEYLGFLRDKSSFTLPLTPSPATAPTPLGNHNGV